eukprot:COSAG02_NODE_1521_length_12162_cov_3.464147_10_plen_123_part_00
MAHIIARVANWLANEVRGGGLGWLMRCGGVVWAGWGGVGRAGRLGGVHQPDRQWAERERLENVRTWWRSRQRNGEGRQRDREHCIGLERQRAEGMATARQKAKAEGHGGSEEWRGLLMLARR